MELSCEERLMSSARRACAHHPPRGSSPSMWHRAGCSSAIVWIAPGSAARRREGRYLLRTNLTGERPATAWHDYIQLVQVEQAFKTLKRDLAIRPVFHQRENRIEAHIFLAFLADCLYVTLGQRLRAPAHPRLTARRAAELCHGADDRRPSGDH
jgi:hypothetical protein